MRNADLLLNQEPNFVFQAAMTKNQENYQDTTPCTKRQIYCKFKLGKKLKAQYHAKVSWQSLASRKTRLETWFSILKNFENWVSSRVP